MKLSTLPTASPKERRELLDHARKACEMLKALSHEYRLLILCLLVEGDRTVSELEEILDMPQAGVSQQLARLRQDGLVTARRNGRSVHYAIASKQVSSVIENLHELFCQPERPPLRRKGGN